MAKVIHVTSAHNRTDTRIYLKECRSLAQQGHRVTLLVADGQKKEERNGVIIESVPSAGGRWRRMGIIPFFLLFKAWRMNADLYHIHDPELIPMALALKLSGFYIVFDAHEDLPKQIMDKHYIPKMLRSFVATSVKLFLRCALIWFDGVIAATPSIGESLRHANSKRVVVNNFPIIGELSQTSGVNKKELAVCYVGGITRIRGLVELVQAMEILNGAVKLKMAGTFGDSEIERKLKSLNGWRYVEYLGVLGRDDLGDTMAKCVAGIVTFLPAMNHTESQPNKMFEYMSAGLPVIGSDFPLWKTILQEGPCGLVVNPEDPRAIADAIRILTEHPEPAASMGKNGKLLVFSKMNWEVEAKKLYKHYDSILNRVKSKLDDEAANG